MTHELWPLLIFCAEQYHIVRIPIFNWIYKQGGFGNNIHTHTILYVHDNGNLG